MHPLVSRFALLLALPSVSVTLDAQASAAEQPRGSVYRPDGRRDPFVSLLSRGPLPEAAAPAARTPGIAGLGVDEVALKGTMSGRDGFVAILQGADQKTYIVRPGDTLFDGAVTTITSDAMVLQQRVHDSQSRPRLREVRKTLPRTDEAPR